MMPERIDIQLIQGLLVSQVDHLLEECRPQARPAAVGLSWAAAVPCSILERSAAHR
jgi:hypothetical protein